MSKSTARMLVVVTILVAAILACQLPGSKSGTPPATTTASLNLTTTNPTVVVPPAGTQVPTQAAAVTAAAGTPTDSGEAAFTSVAQTHAAQTATAGAAAAQASPPSVVLTQGAAGALPRQLNLAFDGKGTLHLFDVGAGSGGLQAVFHQQRGADGAWTKPGQVADKFMALVLGPLPDPYSGCLLWGGQYNVTVTGVFLNCPNGDGSWPATTDPIYKPLTQQGVFVLAAAGGPNSSAGALYVSPANGVETLFYSPINLMLLHGALATTQVSKGQPVLEARLVLDGKGGVHALWLENSGDTAVTLLAAHSSDQGKTWSAPEKLYSGTADNPSRLVMQLVADPAGNVHAAWEGDRKIIYRHWTAAGGWSDVVVISGDKAGGANVRLAVTTDGLARAIWSTVKNPQVVYAAQAADGSWGAPQPIANDQASDLALAVDAKGANHVV